MLETSSVQNICHNTAETINRYLSQNTSFMLVLLDVSYSTLKATAFPGSLLKLHKSQISHRLQLNQLLSNDVVLVLILKLLMSSLLPDLYISVKINRFLVLVAHEGDLNERFQYK